MHKIANIYHFSFSRFVKLLVLVILALATIGVCAAIISMLFGKPIGDDYGAIATYNSGNWIHEAYNSLMNTGRYGQSIASSVLYRTLGNYIVTLLPVAITAWFITLTFFYVRCFLRPHLEDRRYLSLYSFGVSIILTFLILFINKPPDTTNLTAWISYQLFFWPSGIITYTLPLLILLSSFYLLFLSGLEKRISRRAQVTYYVIIVLLSSLFNEVQPAILVIVSLGLFLLSYVRPYKAIQRYRFTLLTTMATAMVGLAGLYFSPGRFERSHILKTLTPSSSNESLTGSIGRNLTTLTHNIYLRPRELALLVIIGILAAFIMYQLTKNKKVYAAYIKQTPAYGILLLIICVISIIMSITLVSIGYGYNSGIYPRTMLIAQISYVITVLFLAFSLSSLLFSKFGINNIFRLGIIIGGLILLVSTPKYIDKILTQVNSSVTYYNEWITQDALLRKAASNNIRETVYLANPAVGIGDGFSLQCVGMYAKSTMWLNVQVTQYYGNQDRVCPASDKEGDQTQNKKWSSL